MTKRLSAAFAAVVGLTAVAAALIVLVGTSQESSAQGGSQKSWVMPHLLERTENVASTQFTFDTTIHATYTAGLPAGTPGPGADLELFLYTDEGALMTAKGGTVVCGPCTFALDGAVRKQSIRIDDLITAKGGFRNKKQIFGFAVIVVSGDHDNVNFQGFVTNTHETHPALSSVGFELQPLSGAGAP